MAFSGEMTADKNVGAVLRVHVPGTHDLGDMVLDKLIGQGALPADIRFRVLGQADPAASLRRAVLAAMDGADPPEFVSDQLPDCVGLPVAVPGDIDTILSELDDDYYRLAHFEQIGKPMGVKTWSTWSSLASVLGPGRADFIDMMRVSRGESSYHYLLRRTVLRDEPLLDFYNRCRARQTSITLGARALLAVGYLLSDNHPELLPEIDRA